MMLCTSGLAMEAKIAEAAGFSVLLGAGNRERTARLVETAIADARCLVSFGIGGGLMPQLRAGDVIISGEVVAEGRSWRGNELLCRRLADLAAEIGAFSGPVLGSRRILATRRAKARAWAETGALAVDLESDLVARAAADAGIPFVVLRAVSDSLSRNLPPAALIPLAEDGTPDMIRVLAAVLRRPHRHLGLLGLARETRRALSALVGPAHALRGLVAPA
jgi:adenosylhomocysteine nucleosidase